MKRYGSYKDNVVYYHQVYIKRRQFAFYVSALGLDEILFSVTCERLSESGGTCECSVTTQTPPSEEPSSPACRSRPRFCALKHRKVNVAKCFNLGRDILKVN